MSYILDALRKADQQRRRGGVPTLPTVISAPDPTEKPVLLYYGLLGGIILTAVGVTVGWLHPWQPEPAVLAPLAASQAAPVPRQAALVLLPPAPAIVEPEAPRHEAPTVVPAPRRKASALVWAETRAGRAATAAANPRKAATQKEHADVAPPADAASPRQPAASADPPLAGPQDLPPMSVAVHAYSSKPRDRLVSINDRLLREGDYLTPDLRLEQITPDGMVFTYRGNLVRRGVH